ncbi:unnamed protein product [Adineta steineri]|uniref:Uncharacterized protein n=1 Tax=Adineta steineri TaxID=433720 RepID=A0A814V3L1_9BILA|nr:unnamed protein product [Adineta steineri]
MSGRVVGTDSIGSVPKSRLFDSDSNGASERSIDCSRVIGSIENNSLTNFSKSAGLKVAGSKSISKYFIRKYIRQYI